MFIETFYAHGRSVFGIPVEARYFIFTKTVQNDSVAHKPSYGMKVKRPGRTVDHSHLPNIEAKNDWRYRPTSVPPVFMVWKGHNSAFPFFLPNIINMIKAGTVQ